VTQEQHTPGPFAFDTTERGPCGLYSEAEAIDGDVIDYIAIFPRDHNNPGREERDADFAMRAMNSHYDMLAALEFVRPLLASNLGQAINASELVDINRIIAKARGEA
jgi:hypothetical protein